MCLRMLLLLLLLLSVCPLLWLSRVLTSILLLRERPMHAMHPHSCPLLLPLRDCLSKAWHPGAYSHRTGWNRYGPRRQLGPSRGCRLCHVPLLPELLCPLSKAGDAFLLLSLVVAGRTRVVEPGGAHTSSVARLGLGTGLDKQMQHIVGLRWVPLGVQGIREWLLIVDEGSSAV